MKFKQDKRPAYEQAKSGLRIVGALLATIGIIALFAMGYQLLIHPRSPRDILIGWTLLASIAISLLATMRFWRLWFPSIPGYIGLRLSWGLFFGWFAPDVSGLRVIVFPLLMFAMVFLSFRFSKRNFRLSIYDRGVLFATLFCLLVAITNSFSLGPANSVLILSAVGDGVLLFSWLHWKRSRNTHGGASLKGTIQQE